MHELGNIKLSERDQLPPPPPPPPPPAKKILCTGTVHGGQTMKPKDRFQEVGPGE